MQLRAVLAGVAGAAVLVAGCTTVGPAPVPAPSAAPAADTSTSDGCPEASERLDDGAPAMAMIDYIDFVQHDGRQYLASPHADAVERADLGEEITTSRCSFSQYNESTGQDPGRARDGDTGFLPPGSPIHAVSGWPPECRLAAEHGGELRLYLALDPTADVATSDTCALD